MASYMRPDSNFMNINRIAQMPVEEVPLLGPNRGRDAVIDVGKRVVKRVVPQVSKASGFSRFLGYAKPVAKKIGRTLFGRYAARLLGPEAALAATVIGGAYKLGKDIMAEDKYRKDKKKRLIEGGYKVLSSEGQKTFEPKFREEDKKKLLKEGGYKVITSEGEKTFPPKIYVTPEPDEPETPAPAPAPVAQKSAPVSAPAPAPVVPLPKIKRTGKKGTAPAPAPVVPLPKIKRTAKGGTASAPVSAPAPAPAPISTPEPVLPPPTTSIIPPIQSPAQPYTTAMTIEPRQSSDHGLYMGPRPVRPIHNFRFPNNRPYNMTNWERATRAKALAMIR
jgi:hypothetical protein